VTGKCPATPRIVGGVKGHNIKMILHCREVPACLPRPTGVAGELQLMSKSMGLRSPIIQGFSHRTALWIKSLASMLRENSLASLAALVKPGQFLSLNQKTKHHKYMKHSGY